MKIQFRDAQNAVFFVDTETLYWAILDGPATEESTKVIDAGDVTNLNYGRFALAPRTEADGVANIAIMPLIHGTKVIIALSCNVPVKDFTMPEPVTEVTYEIVSAHAPDALTLAGKDTTDVDSTAGLAGNDSAAADISGRTQDAGLVPENREGTPELDNGREGTTVAEAPAAS